MFSFKNKPPESSPAAAQDKVERKGLFSRLSRGLSKTGNTITGGMGTLLLGKKEIDDELIAELETRLLMADVGIEATRTIIEQLTNKLKRRQLTNADALFDALKEQMGDILAPCNKPLTFSGAAHKPFVLLVVGVNGSGKTTTIGKLAKRLQQQNKSVMLAAGDTFRAAAVEQLKVWGTRNNVPVISQGSGADSASVIYDAMQSARSKNIDVLIADTAGRLHTQTHLMDELAKVKRVITRLDADAPHEVMLVVDASTGQNALNQARQFHEAIGLTGITVTKLDGTAKGGILFAMASTMNIPIRFIGIGEAVDDLRVFDAYDFAQALLGSSTDAAVNQAQRS